MCGCGYCVGVGEPVADCCPGCDQAVARSGPVMVSREDAKTIGVILRAHGEFELADRMDPLPRASVPTEVFLTLQSLLGQASWEAVDAVLARVRARVADGILPTPAKDSANWRMGYEACAKAALEVLGPDVEPPEVGDVWRDAVLATVEHLYERAGRDDAGARETLTVLTQAIQGER